MAKTLSMLSTIAFVVAGVLLAAAIVLWIVMKIPRVIGDLTGKNARKSVARIRASNEQSGNKSYRPSKTNAARGKITGKMTDSQNKAAKAAQTKTEKIGDKPVPPQGHSGEGSDETELLPANAANKAPAAQTVKPQGRVVPIAHSAPTALLSEDEQVKPMAYDPTDNSGTTTLLDVDKETAQQVDALSAQQRHRREKKLTLIEEVMLINTEEEI